MSRTGWMAVAVTAMLMVAVAGCTGSGDRSGQRRVTPEQFVQSPADRPTPTPKPSSQPASRPGDAAAEQASAAPPAPADLPTVPLDEAPLDEFDRPRTEAETAETAQAADAANSGDQRAVRDALESLPPPRITAVSASRSQPNAVLVDAMVGQVNGRAIYARTVLDPVGEQLAALGRTLSRREFIQRTTEIIHGRLDEIVTNALILGEAERDLSDQERMGLRVMMQDRREEYLRYYGRGSLAVAEETLQRLEGVTLDQKLEEFRQRALVQRYMRQKLLPLVNVTRRDIERYYHDHASRYNPPAKWQVRLIRSADAATAERFAQQLHEGQPFEQVAASRSNLYRSGSGGLMPDLVTQDALPAPLYEVLKELEVGQHAGPIEHEGAKWFVFCQQIERAEGVPLREVQLEIEQTLRRQRYDMQLRRYRERLYAEGSYNDLDQMVVSLVEVALSRYGPMASRD